MINSKTNDTTNVSTSKRARTQFRTKPQHRWISKNTKKEERGSSHERNLQWNAETTTSRDSRQIAYCTPRYEKIQDETCYMRRCKMKIVDLGMGDVVPCDMRSYDLVLCDTQVVSHQVPWDSTIWDPVYSIFRYKTTRLWTLRYGNPHYGARPYGIVHYGTTRLGTLRYRILHYGTRPYGISC